MSKLAKTLTIKKGSTTQSIPFYTTIDEANQYGDYGTAIVDGVTAYYPLGATDSTDTGSSHKTNMGCKKDGKNLYFLTKGNGELPSYNLVLSATSNETITLKYKNRNYKDTGYESEITRTSTSSAQTFSVRKGTTFTASVAGATGYNAGAISAASGTVNAATTVSAGAASLKTYSLTLAGTSNQTITLKYTEPGGSAVTKTSTGSNQAFTVKHGTTWTATIAASTGWNAGALTAASGTVTAATTVNAGAATYKTFTLKLNAMNTNQTITLKYKNKKSDGTFDSEVSKTSTGSAQSFTVGYGTTWTATVSPSTGWTAGALSPGSSGTVTAAVTVSVAAATYKTFTLTKSATNASTNQTLTVQYQNKTSSGTFGTKTTLSSGSVTLGYGSHWWGTVSPSTGWNAGAVTNAGGDSSSLTSNVTVSVAAATHKTVTLTKSATNASTNQTLTVKYKNYNGSSYASEATLSSGSATVGYGTTWTASVSPSTGFNAGALSPGSSGTATANVTVSVGAATRKTFTLTLAGTTNQTITLKYTQPGASAVTKTSTSSNQSFTVQYGTTWTASIAAASGYTAGKLSATSGTVTGNTTVNAGAAVLSELVLTNSKYRIRDLYPDTYKTMTTVPDKLNTSNLTNISQMFEYCSSLTTIPSLNTSKVTDMHGMFSNCKALTTIPQLNTSKVINMSSMFRNCAKLPATFPWAIDCSSIALANNMYCMFENSSVTKVTLKNVKSSIKSEITSKYLKGDNTLTITFA